jgi:putative endonuclease
LQGSGIPAFAESRGRDARRLGLHRGGSISRDPVHRRDIAARVRAHRAERGSKFCKRYGLIRLVYAEQAPTIYEAIAREKAMKKWNRAWKIELIERVNPEWNDLFETINS